MFFFRLTKHLPETILAIQTQFIWSDIFSASDEQRSALPQK